MNIKLLQKLILILSAFSLSYSAYAANHIEPILLGKSNYPETVKVLLHKNIKGSTNAAIFTIPFPPSYIESPNQISIYTESGKELMFYPETKAEWRFIDKSIPSSIRSLKVYMQLDSIPTASLIIKKRSNKNIKHLLTSKPKITSEWHYTSIKLQTEDDLHTIKVKEPLFYATYPPEWLSICLFRTVTNSIHDNSSLQWFDEVFINISKTAYQELDGNAYDDIFKITKFRTWQYDLASTLFNAYIKTGELKWLKSAHLATQVYANFITEKGNWSFKPKPDIKFSYNQSMFIDYLFFSDEELIRKIESVANFVSNWREDYKRSYSFWTERHQTYSFIGALIAWEATGKNEFLTRTLEVANATFNEAENPESSWKPLGCLQHEFTDHDLGEGGHKTFPVCSPWMMALMADVVLRYYIQSGDKKAIHFLYNTSIFLFKYALYKPQSKKKSRNIGILPRYLISSEYEFGTSPFNDKQHTCDVAGLLAKSRWAGIVLNKDVTKHDAAIENLLEACKDNFRRNHRKAPLADAKYWRILPPRKYSWWFGSTSDLTYFYNYSRH